MTYLIPTSTGSCHLFLKKQNHHLNSMYAIKAGFENMTFLRSQVRCCWIRYHILPRNLAGFNQAEIRKSRKILHSQGNRKIWARALHTLLSFQFCGSSRGEGDIRVKTQASPFPASGKLSRFRPHPSPPIGQRPAPPPRTDRAVQPREGSEAGGGGRARPLPRVRVSPIPAQTPPPIPALLTPTNRSPDSHALPGAEPP